MKLYFIALIPEPALREKIKGLKEDMAEKFDSRHALKSPAHITLQPPFKQKKEEEPYLISTLEDFAKEQYSFQVKLTGFGSFPKSTIFIRVANHDPVVNFYRRLRIELKGKIFDRGEEEPSNFHPHMTIATRDLTKKDYSKAWADFQQRPFNESWKVKSLYLLKHNGKNWDIFREFPFEE